MTIEFDTPARARWLRLWSALPASQTHALAKQLAESYQTEDLDLPQSGLGLMPVTDSALGDTYFVGEIPLARAHVRLSHENQTTEGAATLLDDRAGLARALAVLDGVLAARWPGHEEALALLMEGARVVEAENQARRALLASTRVDFALLGTTEEDDDE
ncbi:phosphonate C-P lyase system protein PhnG [Zoogloeaceae bacteirum Par-f-2]|jgi:alpha-D-ribose 1-methylphosphonate 5-triphosphate synthase subunit PhnG|nr:phosphonate C-P lyase system protein PhnG [Zoogloeaceae bacteirum Par-f-2]